MYYNRVFQPLGSRVVLDAREADDRFTRLVLVLLPADSRDRAADSYFTLNFAKEHLALDTQRQLRQLTTTLMLDDTCKIQSLQSNRMEIRKHQLIHQSLSHYIRYKSLYLSHIPQNMSITMSNLTIDSHFW